MNVKVNELSLVELEEVINFWRSFTPALGMEHSLSKEVSVLAKVYAEMIVTHKKTIALDKVEPFVAILIQTWREQMPSLDVQVTTP
jgi:hypothetical protein